ncbi:MAG: hypothetical protein OEZ39_14745 [Gammaproteobacteria bacterium]|nr:hypothetical protein [Gammaproteobacteria bacterium]
MYYTQGNNTGELKNARQSLLAANDPKLHESALLLARTMYEAKDIQGVHWVSNWGGSGVLTQAMQILVDQGVKLDKHAVFLNRPTTRQSKVVELALKLGLKPDGGTAKSRFGPNELIGKLGIFDGYLTAYERMKNDDSYTKLKLAGDIVRETSNIKGAGGVVVAVGAALGLASGVSGSTAALIAFAGAMGNVANMGMSLVETWLPERYNQIKKKIS